jgi:hypothetical protein
MRRRSLLLSTPAALLASMLLLAGCRLLGVEVVIQSPGHLDVVATSPVDVSGQSWGVSRVDATRDDGFVLGEVKGLDATRVTEWRIPIRDPLRPGVHSIEARGARSDAIRDEVVFAISSNPFTIGFAPDLLRGRRAGRGLDPAANRVSLAIFGLDEPEQVEVRLSIESSAGLTLVSDPPELLPPTGQGAPVTSHTAVPVEVRLPLGTPVGTHYVWVRAVGPAGTEPQRALLRVKVPAAPSRTPMSSFEPRP